MLCVTGRSYVGFVFQLHNNVEKLIHQNEELLRKNASLQKQGRMLVEEKSEIIKRLQSTEEANIKLTKLFKDATRQCKDLQQYQMVSRIKFLLFLHGDCSLKTIIC